MNLKELISGIEDTAIEAGRFITAEAGNFDASKVETKGLHDYVTHVDKGAEALIVSRLAGLIPSAGFIVEENTSTAKGEKYNWIVDPLDGTTNFIHGLHPHAVSIALAEDDEIIAGVIHEAAGSETFTAWKGGGAFLNGDRIRVSEVSSAAVALIATGFPYKDFSRLREYLDILTYMIKNTSGLRRMGCASIDLAYTACGRFDAFFEYSLNPWDVAAGVLLVKEAGGTVTDFSGGENFIYGREIIASNSALSADILKIISNFMSK
jgi:myo-inositol-1(or 4)-monophosphatase